MRWLKKEEERLGQYRSKNRGLLMAKKETHSTGREHQVFFNHTWRNLEMCLCWTTCLAMQWKAGILVTK